VSLCLGGENGKTDVTTKTQRHQESRLENQLQSELDLLWRIGLAGYASEVDVANG
jgi:hypothetical protein